MVSTVLGGGEVTTAWLIERTDVQLCYSSDEMQPCAKWVTFTDPDAWRFGSKEAAERIIRERDLIHCHAVSHGWV